MHKILNIGITAHVDAGKTSLTERMLFLGGAIRTAGSVDAGTASTDRLAVEQRRGISVKTGCASVCWNDTKINFIDTPGHADFLSEVERSLPVLDLAVLVVSAVEGIQPQTELLLNAFAKSQMPFLVFVNKLDRVGSDAHGVYGALCKKMPCRNFLLASHVEHAGETDCSVKNVDFLKTPHMEDAVVACGNNKLFELFLECPQAAEKQLPGAMHAAIADGIFTPVFCGSAKLGLGIAAFMEMLSVLAVPVPAETNTPLSAMIYKVEHDRHQKKICYIRMFSGRLQNRQMVSVLGRQAEKVTQIQQLAGNKALDCDAVLPGEIARIYGLNSAKSGDILGIAPENLRQYPLSVPLLLSKVSPKDPAQLTPLIAALQALSDEDPAMDFVWIREKQELQIKIAGTIQLEVLAELLRESYQIGAEFSAPSVIYKETPLLPAEGFDAYTMPKPCWAVLRFLIEPLPPGSGLVYSSKVSDQKILYRYQHHVETAVPRALQQGLHGWEVTDLRVTLIDGEHHNIHTHPLDFFLATPLAIMDGLKNAGTKLLEPICALTFHGPAMYLGKILSLVNLRRGTVVDTAQDEAHFRLTAHLPLAEILDLQQTIASITGGTCLYHSGFSHYAPCPAGVQATRDRIGVNPLERSKFILYMRDALQA